MKFLLGIKQNMTQIFGENGEVLPVTVLATSPLTVTQVKTAEKDGYKAVQLGFGTKNAKNVKKPQKGHLKDLGNFKFVKEYKLDSKENAEMKVGDKIDLSAFTVGDVVEVSATSKGKGFQGVVKRHGFKGGPRSHGQKHSEREPGSISGGLRTVLRHGKRMAGRLGGDRTTVKNLKIAQINKDAGLVLVTGAIPGRRGTLVEVRG